MRSRVIVGGSLLVLAVAVTAFFVMRRSPPPRKQQRPLASIKPERHMKAHIVVPDLGHDSHALIAEIEVPNGYYMAMWGNEVTFQRSPDPAIWLRSLATVDALSGSGEVPPLPFIDQNCGGVQQGQRAQIENSEDGWSIVCRGNERGHPTTLVVRDVRQLGNEVQCVVEFADRLIAKNDDDPDGWTDHGNPSPARVKDALAICGSLKLRTFAENDEHEHWNGHEWVKSAQ